MISRILQFTPYRKVFFIKVINLFSTLVAYTKKDAVASIENK